jgi:5-formyltetrahydrofolate cyclo-ligase
LGILEPGDEIRTQASRRAALGELHLIVVPGVAFDPRGGRVGHGRGYYDRLLRRARSETPVVGLGFECQIFAEVPMLDHDVFVDKVITEKRIYTRGERGRKGQAALV